MGYKLEEQETVFYCLRETGKWTIETNVPHEIIKYRKMMIPETIFEEIEDGRVVRIRGELNQEEYKIKPAKRPPKRELTDEEREELSERMKKAQAARRANLEKKNEQSDE